MKTSNKEAAIRLYNQECKRKNTIPQQVGKVTESNSTPGQTVFYLYGTDGSSLLDHGYGFSKHQGTIAVFNQLKSGIGQLFGKKSQSSISATVNPKKQPVIPLIAKPKAVIKPVTATKKPVAGFKAGEKIIEDPVYNKQNGFSKAEAEMIRNL